MADAFVQRELGQLFKEVRPFLGQSYAVQLPLGLFCQSIVQDSRHVTPGAVFVAVQGDNEDGHDYIQAAIQRGAIAVVGEKPLPELSVPYLRVADSRLALAYLAAGLYQFPARKLTVIGVTGTDGKTTTVNLLYEMCKAAGIRVGMISTVGAVVDDHEVDTGFHVTTPDAPAVQQLLWEMVRTGITHVIIETTSHGLAQDRVAACEFDIGIVTNITHEHLDYHGTYEDYIEAKGKLFRYLAETVIKPRGNPRLAVLNRDDSSYQYLIGQLDPNIHTISYGESEQADVRSSNIQFTPVGTTYFAAGKELCLRLELQLMGEYNVSNSLAALGAAYYGLRIEGSAIESGVRNLSGVPGRMQLLEIEAGFYPIVDFAHTPNALKRALLTARQMLPGKVKEKNRIIAVFGSAGLRDREKRRMMAEVGQELADICIFTAEDPRTESLDAILAEMAAGAIAKGGEEGSSFFRIPDRREALRQAVRIAKPGDIVLALGKGHEQSMCFGNVEYHWDDRTALMAAVCERLNIPGPDMPYLPFDFNN